MKRILAVIAASLSLSACGKQIKDFVESGPGRDPSGSVTSPSTSSSQAIGIKISPGSNILSGSQVSGQATITPTNRTVKGTQVESIFSFHRNRPSP